MPSVADAFEFFAPCARGLEDPLAEELRALGLARVRAARAGVAFAGGLADGYRACLWSRLASRVLVRIAEVPAGSPEELYESVVAMSWEDHLDVDSTLAVDFTAARSPITHTKYGALKVKDAIVDRFRDRTGSRPNVDVVAPDVRINVAARVRSAVVSIDLSGDALHRRGYREEGIQVEAPLKETLAAGVLALAGWPAIAAAGGGFADPMCGSGTLAIEAAMVAGDVAPGILRARWGFDRWRGHDAAAWDSLLAEADARAEAGRSCIPPVAASDIDPRAIAVARACVARAGLSGHVTVTKAEARTIAPPPGAAAGLVALNPPYGERLGDRAQLRGLYAGVGSRLREAFAGWQVAMIATDRELVAATGLVTEREHEVYNGRIPAFVAVLSTTAAPATAVPATIRVDSMFANRLRKNLKARHKWAGREGITCYRLYDADMPEYAVAIDVYAGAGPDEGRTWAHVAEYAPPRSVDAADATRRLDEVMETLPHVLGIPPDDVFLKVRKRQKGTAQYERLDSSASLNTVAEDGLLYLVNFTDYLDTGLFLDHRTTRRMIRDAAKGTRFLNLFAYTGTASVCAAAGGAASTLTVDLSKTYSAWAERNIALNGFDGEPHRHIQADVLTWLKTSAAAKAGPFDLVFLDPPTFSNSKRMSGSFDVQRDHVALVRAAMALLSPGGTLLFSNNMRDFEADLEALADFDVRDITAATIPPDFERNPRIHNAWRIARAGEGGDLDGAVRGFGR